jgi:hypothetical protein
MTLTEILNDKTIKPKEKTGLVSGLLLSGAISAGELAVIAGNSKDPIKATCIEALEFATNEKPSIVTKDVFRFVTTALTAKAPRVKWESARVIGNSAALFKDDLDEAIRNLLVNSEHDGTVVRWSAAFALGEILKLKTKHNNDLLPAVEAIIQREEKNSIRKIYLSAIKKSG